MVSRMIRTRLVWLALGLPIGLLVGLMLGGLWPHTPLHAVATDRAESILVATGLVDENCEAVYFLDSLTGNLFGGVPMRQKAGMPFQAMWHTNVNVDLQKYAEVVSSAGKRRVGPALSLPKTPRYIMVTGLMDIGQGASRERPSRSMIYVVEANTGIVLAYTAPWSVNDHTGGRAYRRPLMLWSAETLSTAVVREREE